MRSAWRVMHQKPWPVGLVVPVHGVLAAEETEHLVVAALPEHVRIEQVRRR
jgi:hypothetical protein